MVYLWERRNVNTKHSVGEGDSIPRLDSHYKMCLVEYWEKDQDRRELINPFSICIRLKERIEGEA